MPDKDAKRVPLKAWSTTRVGVIEANAHAVLLDANKELLLV